MLKTAWQASCSSAWMVPWCTRVVAVLLMNWARPLAKLRAACSRPCSAAVPHSCSQAKAQGVKLERLEAGLLGRMG